MKQIYSLKKTNDGKNIYFSEIKYKEKVFLRYVKSIWVLN